jgi:hypothetical protein
VKSSVIEAGSGIAGDPGQVGVGRAQLGQRLVGGAAGDRAREVHRDVLPAGVGVGALHPVLAQRIDHHALRILGRRRHPHRVHQPIRGEL